MAKILVIHDNPQVQPGAFGVCLQLDCGHQHQGLQAGPGHLRETLRWPVKNPSPRTQSKYCKWQKKVFHIPPCHCPLSVLKLRRSNSCRNVVFRGGHCSWQWVQGSTLLYFGLWRQIQHCTKAFSPSFCPSALEGWHVVICWPCPSFGRSLTSPEERVLPILSSCRHLEAGSHLHLHSPSELTECFPEGVLEFAVCSEGIQGSSSEILYHLSKLRSYSSWYWFELVCLNDRGVTLPGPAAIVDNNTDQYRLKTSVNKSCLQNDQ